MNTPSLDRAALRAIREFADEMLYALVDFRLSFDVPAAPTGFPRYAALRDIIEHLDSVHRVLFRLFRLGEAVNGESVAGAVPPRVLQALTATGVLEADGAGGWRTPGLLLVPVEGLLMLVAVPRGYPTAGESPDPWFDLSSYAIARALPGSLEGCRVLDLCSGSGVQSLLCAARGATSVVGLELSPRAVQVARASAVLNGLDHRVEFRVSDALAGLCVGERFDFVVCNTPYTPVLAAVETPRTLDEVGNSVLMRALDRLPACLAPSARGVLATWRSPGSSASTAQLHRVASRLERHGFTTVAHVDRAPDNAEAVLSLLRGDLEQRPGATPEATEAVVLGVAELLRRCDPPVDGFYNQLIYFQQRTMEYPGMARAIFGLSTPASAEAAI